MLPWTFNQFARDLSQFDEPNTLYAFMESIVNFDRDESDKVKIKNLSKFARFEIFDFDYPISKEFGKEEFETLFLNHYMFRRINFDTLTSFKIHLQIKLNSIMPKYNKMIEGFNKIKFDGTVETHERTQQTNNVGESNGVSNVKSTSKDTSETDTKYSDTPEGKLNDIKSGDYMSEYTLNGASSNGESTSESINSNTTNDNGNLIENITIKRGDSIEEYQKFLEIVSNIYQLIFKECDDLFYGLI